MSMETILITAVLVAAVLLALVAAEVVVGELILPGLGWLLLAPIRRQRPGWIPSEPVLRLAGLVAAALLVVSAVLVYRAATG